MKIVNMHQAKTHLSKLIKQVRHGEEILIGISGKPVARLSAFDQTSAPRKLGAWKGKVKISRDFDRTPRSLIKLFYGD